MCGIPRVWDGEVSEKEQAMELCPRGNLLIRSDSRAAIQAVVKAGKRGRTRSGALGRVVDTIGARTRLMGRQAVHAGIQGNEVADELAGRATLKIGRGVVTCGGLAA